jgi:hypothetical protein
MQIDYVKVWCKEDVHICHTNFAKKMEQNLHETSSWWKIYGKWLFSKDLEVWDGMYSTPIFWSLHVHLEVLNLPSLMELGDFIFFSILFLLKLEDTWTFISTVGILVSWKSEITKNSTRIASVMEFFCALLQCKVHLSMFHSSPTSKIWFTST